MKKDKCTSEEKAAVDGSMAESCPLPWGCKAGPAIENSPGLLLKHNQQHSKAAESPSRAHSTGTRLRKTRVEREERVQSQLHIQGCAERPPPCTAG